MRRRSLLATLLAVPVARQALAEGDNWPVRPVRVVCPFTAGGSQDNVARRLSVKNRLGHALIMHRQEPTQNRAANNSLRERHPIDRGA